MEIKTKYKVSVIVPVYNVERYLTDCVNSLLNQKIDSIQIILVDDGARDRSGEIADEFARIHDNVECYHKENGGSASARNEGLKYARGEYIAFLDADDWVDAEAYLELYEIAKRHGDIDVVFYKSYGPDSYYVPRAGAYSRQQIIDELFPFLLPSIDKDGKPIYTRWSSCMRFYRAAFIFDNHLRFNTEVKSMEDLLFTFESTIAANSYYYYDKELYHVVENLQSKSRNYRKKMFSHISFMLSSLKTIILNHPDLFPMQSYYQTSLYLLEACVANEMRIGNLIGKTIRIKEIVKSNVAYELTDHKNEVYVTGEYAKMLDLLSKHDAFYIVYRLQIRPHIIKGIRCFKHM